MRRDGTRRATRLLWRVDYAEIIQIQWLWYFLRNRTGPSHGFEERVLHK